MIKQRIVGLGLILCAVALSFVIYGTYWFSLEATTVGRVANIAIVVMFLIVGVFYLVKDSRASFWR